MTEGLKVVVLGKKSGIFEKCDIRPSTTEVFNSFCINTKKIKYIRYSINMRNVSETKLKINIKDEIIYFMKV